MPTKTAAKKQVLKQPTAALSIADRTAAKRAARDTCLLANNWKKAGRTPIIAIVTADAETKMLSSLREACKHLAVYVIEIDTVDAAGITAADIAIFPTVNLAAGRSAATALAAGTVPVMTASIAPKDIATDYDPVSEAGNSFFAADESVWGLLAALIRATESYRFSYDWQGITRAAFEATKK